MQRHAAHGVAQPGVGQRVGQLGDESSIEPLIAAVDWNAGMGNDKKSRAAANTNERVAKGLGYLAKPGNQTAISALKRLAERLDGEWTVIDVLETIRGEAIESPYIYARDGRPHILVNNWKDGGQALWTAAVLGGRWSRDPADLRGFAWELLELDAGHLMASRVWGSSVMLTSIDLEDLSATNMIYPDCYTGSAPLLPARTPVWTVELR